jgi:hypothetical protein
VRLGERDLGGTPADHEVAEQADLDVASPVA